VFVLISIILSLVDAALTLYLIHHGASEVNPVMNFFLQFGPGAFISAKYILTSGSVLLLVINQEAYLLRTRIRARALFWVIIFIFLSVIIWELYLIFYVI